MLAQMKGTYFLASLLLGFFFSFPSFAAEDKQPHRLTIGTGIAYRNYNEDLIFPAKSDEYGHLYGLQLGYEYIKAHEFYTAAEMSFLRGSVTYDGSKRNLITHVVTPYVDTTNSTIYQLEGRFGYTFTPYEKCILIPFVALGYHRWFRGKADGVESDYSETYTWPYLSLGMRLEYALTKDWDIGLNVQGMLMVDGQMKASMLDTSFDLGNRAHFACSIPITKHVRIFHGSDDAVRFIPYYSYQEIGASPVQQGFFEPSSTTHLSGLRIELVHYF